MRTATHQCVAILKGANNCVARVAKKALFECDCREKAQALKIGQGNDRVDESMERCGSEIYVILEFVKRIDQAEIEIDWSKNFGGDSRSV